MRLEEYIIIANFQIVYYLLKICICCEWKIKLDPKQVHRYTPYPKKLKEIEMMFSDSKKRVTHLQTDCSKTGAKSCQKKNFEIR